MGPKELGMCLGLVCLVIVACEATWNFEAGVDLKELNGELEMSYDGTRIDVEETPDDTRVDIDFTDENGDVVPPGAQGVGEGDQVTPPVGATTAVITGPSSAYSCTGCSAMLWGGPCQDRVAAVESVVQGPADAAAFGVQQGIQSGGREPAVALPRHFIKRWVYIMTFIPDYAGTGALGNPDAWFEVTVPSVWTSTDIYENLIRTVLQAGPGYDLPNGQGISVDVSHYYRFIPHGVKVNYPAAGGVSRPGSGSMAVLGHGLRVIAADVTQDFVYYELDVNGVKVAASPVLSSPSTYYAAPNGWKVVDVNVPDTLLQYNATSFTFDGLLRTQTVEDPTIIELSANMDGWKP